MSKKNSLTPQQGVQFLYILHQPLQNNENQKKNTTQPPNHPTTQPPPNHPSYGLSEKSRTHLPGPVRPARPARCWAAAWETQRSDRCRTALVASTSRPRIRPLSTWEVGRQLFFREFSNQTADILDGKFSERNLRENPLSYGRFWRSLNMKVARKFLLIAVILSFDG